MFNTLYIGAVSACFELQNDNPYYAPLDYTVAVDGCEQFRSNTNVFSVFGLKPGTEHTVTLTGADGASSSVTVTTKTVAAGLSVKDFGAAGDGVTDDTRAIQTALHFLPAGGLLHFPAGTYRTGALALKSHITLEFAKDAVLLGSTDRKDYPVLPGELSDIYSGESVHFGGFEGNVMPMYQAFVTAEYAEDITIVGPGTVDGNAQNSDFWVGFKENPIARPRLFFFNRCKDITVHGILAQNSASWQFHPYYSDRIDLLDISIKAPKDSPNTDAIDPESCAHVNIIGCKFSVGDDCIAIKSSKIELGRKYKKAADFHTIRNCLMEFGHGAVTLGSEIGAGVKNLSVSQCYFKGTDRGLRIKSRRGRGVDCHIDNVLFENLHMDGVLTPFVINMWYNCCDPDCFSEYVWSRNALPIDERTPRMGKFTFRNITCENAEVAACYIDGLVEKPIEEVVFEDVSVTFAENAKPGVPSMQNFAKEECRLGLYIDNARKVTVNRVRIHGAVGEKLIVNHCDQLNVSDFEE